ncbi:hypothetical protein XELAEV_18002285mg [Xenopus laevis]|nr:hypothetical protein XELAEV_18002285mg [Xenopus laevis]
MIGVGVSVTCICSVSGLMLQSDWFPPSRESTSSSISPAELLFRLHPMIGVGISVLLHPMIGVGASVPCICSVSGLMLQSDWLPSAHEADST